MRKLASAVILLIFISISVSAQTDDEEIQLPKEIMRDVVVRVLRDKFKPADSPRTVELYEEGLSWEWLPAVSNVFFVLVSKEEIRIREIKVHFFKNKVRRDKRGEIFVDFGFGDPFCSADGSTWSYSEKKGPSSLRESGGWGMVCCQGSGQ